MRETGVFARYRKKYKVTTNSNHKQPVFENVLDRQFSVTANDQAYVRTQEGWLYLAVVIDLFSRRVVVWSMSSRMKAKLVTKALCMALWQRQPKPGLIVHSDRGSQYASKVYRRLLKNQRFVGRIPSSGTEVSRKGDCWDNSVAESFFASLKKEQVHWRSYQTRLEAQQDILGYIAMFYNSRRLHSYLGYVSPSKYESTMGEMRNAA